MGGIDEQTLSRIEREHARGLTSAEILALFAESGVSLSEATLRKYVQLGLLPRSVRVGKKGKHQGSQGIYPVSVVRQIMRIKQMMAQRLTIEQTLARIFGKLDGVIKDRRREPAYRSVAREVGDARALSKDLLFRLTTIETRLTSEAQVARAHAS